ncbi:MAG: cellulase family glycosylhydrolase [Lachnospiraceae bacterium]
MKKYGKGITAALLVAILAVTSIGCGKKDVVTTSETTASVVTETEEVTTEEKTEKTQEVKADYVFTLKGGNRWENNGLTCEQFDGLIKNYTGDSGSDWKVELTVPEGAKLENGWNGNYELSGTKLTITAVDYNEEIPSKGEVSFGFILDTKGQYNPDGKITIGGKVYAVNDQSVTVAETDTTEEKTEEKTTEERNVAQRDTSGTPFANHGKLSVKGTDIVDKNGKVYQLRGVSTHGLAWFPDYVNTDAFSDFASFGANAIRLAMYTDEYGGYCNGGDQNQLKSLIDKGVKACDELGMYVIIDWHILHDNDPTIHQGEAEKFFEEISKKYADHENVIYEICNEPNGGTTWDTVKGYAETIIPIIRKNDKDAIIIVGTPTWSQDVDIASENPIEGQSNIMYAVHFYASTHKQEIRDKVEKARDKGLAVIISECSICEASGNGSINYDEANAWADLIAEDNLSFFAWNLSNKDEQSSLLKSSVTKTSGFTKDDLSETGKWFVDLFGK